jgi:hypothetical protein
VHDPLTQVLLLPVHDVPTVQVPAVPHVSVWLVAVHPSAPETQEPVQAPATQVWLVVVHDVPTVHVPVALHVSVWFDAEQLS